MYVCIYVHAEDSSNNCSTSLIQSSPLYVMMHWHVLTIYLDTVNARKIGDL